MKIIVISLLLVTGGVVLAQNNKKVTISGYVKDAESTENMIGATVYNKIRLEGTTTNQYGFYSLTLPVGNVELLYSFVGYETQVLSFNLQRDTTININLSGQVHLKEVEITGRRSDHIQERTQMSTMNIPIARIKSLPAFLGEVDLLKVLQLMPGVQSGGEGTSGLYVRGGGPDQNLILLDGVPVYNASHLFGFFSVFNADAINSAEILKGGFPARYGGRTSSVLDINMKEGNMQKFHGEGAIGLISAKLTLEGPIWKDHTSFIVSARRTYVDVLMAPFIALANSQMGNEKVKMGYYFYDLTAKINHKFSDKDRIYLSAYLGDDKFYMKDEWKDSYGGQANDDWNRKSESSIKWGNVTAAFRWNHIFTNKLFGNTTLTYSRYRFHTGYGDWDSHNEADWSYDPPQYKKVSSYYGSKYQSGIQDWGAKAAFDYLPSPDHYARFGGQAVYHTFNPGVMASREDSLSTSIGARKIYAWEYSLYAEDDIRLTDKLKVNLGIHWSGFSVRDEFYDVWQPRISARYLITGQLSVKASYSRMAQYIHLLTNANIGLPTDLWVPTTESLRPQTSDQVAIGLVRNFSENYEVSIEGYYKKMSNVMEYKEGASFFDATDSWEQKILQGMGRSYGVEVFAQKKTGSFTGWIGYTLSWTNRRFDEINGGAYFPYKYDRRHDISVALVKRMSDKIELSGTWVFGTGNCVTIPTGSLRLADPFSRPDQWQRPAEYVDYAERNGYRMAAYHRLDLSISFIKKKKWGERRWVLGLYNTYCRRNPFYIDMEWNYNNDRTQKKVKYVQYSLFPVIPSISYHFKF